jgi:hypothetical protein
MRNTLSLVIAAFALLLAMTGTALARTAADVPPDLGDLLELAKPVLDAILAGQYWLAAAGALILAVGLVRRYVVPKVPFLQTDAGGTLLTFVVSFGGAMATSIAASAGIFSLALVKPAFGLAFAAIGGFLAVKRLVIPVFDWLADITPWAPLKWTFRYVPFLIDLLMGSKNSAKAIEKAEKAAADAIITTPSAGGGEPRDVL